MCDNNRPQSGREREDWQAGDGSRAESKDRESARNGTKQKVLVKQSMKPQTQDVRGLSNCVLDENSAGFRRFCSRGRFKMRRAAGSTPGYMSARRARHQNPGVASVAVEIIREPGVDYHLAIVPRRGSVHEMQNAVARAVGQSHVRGPEKPAIARHDADD